MNEKILNKGCFRFKMLAMTIHVTMALSKLFAQLVLLQIIFASSSRAQFHSRMEACSQLCGGGRGGSHDRRMYTGRMSPFTLNDDHGHPQPMPSHLSSSSSEEYYRNFNPFNSQRAWPRKNRHKASDGDQKGGGGGGIGAGPPDSGDDDKPGDKTDPQPPSPPSQPPTPPQQPPTDSPDVITTTTAPQPPTTTASPPSAPGGDADPAVDPTNNSNERR